MGTKVRFDTIIVPITQAFSFGAFQILERVFKDVRMLRIMHPLASFVT